MSGPDFDSTQTSRSRLLMAGKTLFAKNGYEQTSTAAIARESGSSESQLIRYFGGKAGLLEAIFNESWTTLNQYVQEHIEQAAHLMPDHRRCAEVVSRTPLHMAGCDRRLADLVRDAGGGHTRDLPHGRRRRRHALRMDPNARNLSQDCHRTPRGRAQTRTVEPRVTTLSRWLHGFESRWGHRGPRRYAKTAC